MPKAAILIDWENLVLGLNNGRYAFTPGSLAARLLEKATTRAKAVDPSNTIDYAAAFAPANAFDASTVQALLKNKVEARPTRGGKQAADLAVAVEAMRLYHAESGFTEFFLVTGDIDYLTLAEALDKGLCRCHVWAIDRNRTNADIRNWHRVDYVPELLKLRRDRKPTPEEQLVFLLMCHRVLDQGVHFGGVNHVHERLVALGILDRTKVQQRWELAEAERVIDRYRVIHADGTVSRLRRLSYERPAVLRELWLADLCVRHAYRRDAVGRGDLLAVLDHRWKADADTRDEFIEALVTSGYLLDNHGKYLPADQSARYGVLAASLHVVLAALAEQAAGKDLLGFGRLIFGYWPRVYKPGGNLNDVEAAESKNHAQDAIQRVLATCCMTRGRIVDASGRVVTGLTLAEDHELVRFVKSAVRLLITELENMGATQRQAVRADDVKKSMSSLDVNPWTDAETEFWLGACATHRMVTWRQGDVFLNNTPLRALIPQW